jgi:small subunit ribosomal protein S6
VRPYELLFVLRPELEGEALEAAHERVRRLIEQQGGVIESVDRWGRRRLAYEIDHCRDGYYTVLHFQANPGATREIERGLRLAEEVLRYLIVRRDER